MKKQVLALILVVLMAPFVVEASEHLIPLQGYASDSSSLPVSEGNISVRVYDAATVGNLIYDSGNDFDNTITDGIFDVVLGSITPLDLDNTKKYYMEIDINGEEVVGDATSGRQSFWPGSGDHSRNESWFDLQDIPPDFADGIDNVSSLWKVSGDNVYRQIGNVGIGTNTPNSLLSLDGVPVISVDTTDGNDNNFLGLSGGGQPAVWQAAHMFLVGNEQYPYGGSVVIFAGFDGAMDSPDKGAVIFYTGPGASGTERMRIDRDGKIGIGTDTPNSTLEVVGTIHSTSGGIKFPDGTVQTTAGGGWSLTGNAGTNPAVNFLGTVDNRTLEIWVNNTRVMRFEPSTDPDWFGGGFDYSPNVIGGVKENYVSPDKVGATISGGGRQFSYWHMAGPWPNQVTDHFGTIGGGFDNYVGGGVGSTVGGGVGNNATGDFATICGGGDLSSLYYNKAIGDWSTVGGGGANLANKSSATVSGGRLNTALGFASTVSGGSGNKADGSYATVGGGNSQIAEGSGTTVCGGWSNTAFADGATIAGGEWNNIRSYLGTIGGGSNNDIWDMSFLAGGTIAGGYFNSVGDMWTFSSGVDSTVGGGRSNTVIGNMSVISGGASNWIDWANLATIGGGGANRVSGKYGTIAGGGPSDEFDIDGTRNHVVGDYGTIGGGGDNKVLGLYGTVPGGLSNLAGNYGFAAGRRAKANHEGTFVWADSKDSDFSSTNNNQFLIRAKGGVGIGTNNPTHKLTVNSTTDDTLRLIGPDSFGHGARINFGDSDYVYIEEDEDDKLYLYGSSRISLMGGNVGIGTTTPSSETKLDIVISTDDFGVLVGAGNAGSEIGLHTATAKYSSLVKNAYWNAGNWHRFDTGSGAFLQEITPNGDTRFKTEAPGTNPITWDNTLTLQTDGDVGIGTTSPSYKLDVEGYIQAYGYYTGDIIFQKDGEQLWRMFEEEEGLYVEKVESGEIYELVLQEKGSEELSQLKERVEQLEKQMEELLEN